MKGFDTKMSISSKIRNLIFVVLLAIVVIASSIAIIQTIDKTSNEEVAFADYNPDNVPIIPDGGELNLATAHAAANQTSGTQGDWTWASSGASVAAYSSGAVCWTIPAANGNTYYYAEYTFNNTDDNRLNSLHCMYKGGGENVGYRVYFDTGDTGGTLNSTDYVDVDFGTMSLWNTSVRITFTNYGNASTTLYIKTMQASRDYEGWTITLDQSVNVDTPGEVTSIYEVNQYGYFLDNSMTNRMTTTSNPISTVDKLPKKEGYTFEGYYSRDTHNDYAECYIDKNGYLTSDALGEYLAGENVTLYAKMVPTTYHLLFDDNGGSGGPGSVDVRYKSDYPELENYAQPTMDGYVFFGYYDKTNPTDVYDGLYYYGYRDSYWSNKYSVEYNKTEDTQLYAIWKLAPAYEITTENVVYDGNEHGGSVSVTLPAPADAVGDNEYTIYYGTQAYPGTNTSSITFTEAGTHKVYFTISFSMNAEYGTVYGSFDVVIEKADITTPIVAPTAITGLKYDASQQVLINAGSTEVGTMKYKVGNGSYKTSVSDIKATDVNTYTITYYVDGGNNYNNTAEQSFTVTIAENDKTALLNKISDATTYKASIATEYSAVADALQSAINTAQGVYDTANVTAAAIGTAITNLQAAIDTAHGDVVDAIISAIGTVEYTDASKAKIDAARAAYDALTADEKAYVDNLATLTTAESTYATLQVNAVKDLITAIGTVEYPGSKQAIEAARAAYDALPEALKPDITNYSTLQDAEALFNPVENVVGLANDIKTVEDSEAYRAKVKSARDAYDALSADQKALLPADVLTTIQNAEAAVSVMNAINAIGTVKYPDSKQAIDTARAAYDALTDDQKALISEDMLAKLTGAESTYESLEDLALRSKVEDEEKGVAIETDGTAGIPKNVELRVVVQTEVSTKEGAINVNTVNANIKKTQKITKVYDVTLILKDENGKEHEIQPSDIKEGMTIKIHMEIPEGVRTKGLNVLHIHDDGTTELIKDVKVEGNIAIIEVSSLSQFALVEKTGHGFCVGVITLIFAILGLLCCALYFILRYGLFKDIVAKCKLDCLYKKIKLVGFIGLCAADALFIFALIALCLHPCALTIVSFILLLLVDCAFRLFFLEDIKVITLPKLKMPVSKKAQKKQQEEDKRIAKEEAAKNAAEEEEKKKLSEYKHMSKWGLEASKKIEKDEDPNGILAVGIIQNRKGKVYMFDPNGYTVAPGDIVEITDLAGEKKAVAVVIGNHMAPKERIVDPFKPINCVLYAPNQDAEKEAALKAQQEAEEKARQEEEARLAAEEAAKREAEEKARKEAEEAERRAQEEAEAKAKAEAEEQARKEEEARIAIEKAKLEEEDKLRELEAQKAQAEAEAKAKAEAEEKARLEAEEKARREAEALSLKESIAKAKATTSSHKFSKKYVADYLRGKENVEVNERGNLTSTGLPLADTHYVNGKCFAYIYETEGSIILLAKMNDEYASKLKERHENVNLSAFPKQKDTWYSLIIDDTYSKEEFEYIIDDLIGAKHDEGMTLKESIALAKATTSSHKFTKAYVCEYLNSKENIEVNTRGNFTKTGLPLADTHYVIRGDKKECFAYVYETEGSIILLAKMDSEYAKGLQQRHAQVNLSAFPKQKNTWYSLIIDDSYTKEEFEKIIDDISK